jgi:ATP-dependent phosphofructokinase / diphosphate-dependent phosphofructokinase
MSRVIVIAQGGGPTAVINQTLAGAVIEARRRDPNAKVLGARHGVRGVAKGDLVDLTALSDDYLRRIANTPSAALGSTRDKPDEAYCERVLEGLRKAGADTFVYIGGNDTAGTLDILDKAGGGTMAFVHAPKTIDNDLVENDHTPGFISAGLFVAQAFHSLDLDFKALPGLYVGIVMGRHAGFLTAASAAWRRSEADGPHLVYIPEVAFSVERFLGDIQETLAKYGRCVVAMSEGVNTEDGRPLAEGLIPEERRERDAHGNLQLSGGDLGLALQARIQKEFPKSRGRVDTFGYLPRGFVGAVSPVDQKEAFDIGAFAVSASADGSGSVALQFADGRTDIRLVPLDAVAGRTRHMPADFLDPGSAHISQAGAAYLRRLLPEPPEGHETLL